MSRSLPERKPLRDSWTRKAYRRSNRFLPLYATQAWAAESPRLQALSGSPIDLAIRNQAVRIDGRNAVAKTINGSMPGPLLRFRQGEEATIRVTTSLQRILLSISTVCSCRLEWMASPD